MNGIRLPVDAVQWHEGMLLAPQHFQQSALRQEQLVHYHVLTAVPFHWGVRQLRVDPVALVNGTFRVTALEAVMPDGLAVGLDADDPEPLELDLTENADEFRNGVTKIYLAVPAQRGEGAPTSGALARFLSVQGRAVADENTGEGELRVPRLRPRLNLLIGDTPPEKFVSFPIGEVRLQDEYYALTDFVPPALSVPEGTPLAEASTAVARRAREKAAFLSEKVRASANNEKPQLLQDMRAAVRALSPALPPLEAMLATGAVHPFTLYLSLASLAGHLSGLGATQVPPVFPRYDHNNLRDSFAPVFNFANRMLDGVHESYDVRSFAEDEGRFTLRIGEDQFTPTLYVGAVVPSGVSESAVAEWMEGAQIGSASRMASIRDRRIRGAARERVAVAEEIDLAPSRGVVLFAIKTDSDAVLPDEDLVIFNPGDAAGKRRPAEIVFYVRSGINART